MYAIRSYYDDTAAVVPLMVIGLVPLYLLRRRMNLMSLGDEEVTKLGVDAVRITSYNVCYTKLLRDTRRLCQGPRALGE